MVTARPAPAAAPPSRRAVVAGLAIGAAAGLAGCSSPGATLVRQPRPATSLPPDELARARAITRGRYLADAAVRAGRQDRAQRAVLSLVAAHHLRHLAALGDVRDPARPVSTPPPPLVPPRTTPAVTVGPVDDVAQLAVQEAAAAQEAAAGAAATSSGLAVLLARIAAARAVHARLLGGRRPALPTAVGCTGAGCSVEALQALLAGQHAAVWGYGLVVARATPAGRRLAQPLWAEHEDVRDLLRAALETSGAEPVPAAPAYAVPAGASPRDLARRIEAGTARLAAAAAGDGGSGTRALGAGLLVAAAVRQQAWGDTPALPGG
ncbi:MAG: DUF4439 domain-containing protein [Kineosporiaceae bacterium]